MPLLGRVWTEEEILEGKLPFEVGHWVFALVKVQNDPEVVALASVSHNLSEDEVIKNYYSIAPVNDKVLTPELKGVALDDLLTYLDPTNTTKNEEVPNEE
jgi:hypothetical protein